MFTVLLSLYYKEAPQYLRQSLDSIFPKSSSTFFRIERKSSVAAGDQVIPIPFAHLYRKLSVHAEFLFQPYSP